MESQTGSANEKSLPEAHLKPSPLKKKQEERIGKDTLLNGMLSILRRQLLLTSSPPKDDAEMNALALAWYDGIIDEVPAIYWKDVAMWASRYVKPYDKFTIGQFFEAWEMYRQAGKARGYETWRQ